METLNTIILGIVQGLTEFLPVSSSGHLTLAKTFMGVDEPGMFLDIMLHVATGLAVVIVFRKDIWALVNGWFSRDAALRKESFTYSGWIVLASVPAAFVGVVFKKHVEALYDTSGGKGAAYLVAGMLIVTAGLLYYSSWKTRRMGDTESAAGLIGKLTLLQVIGIGLIQAVAIMPGISRSGSTIAMALILGVSRTEAGRFSFMIALPAIFGAAFLDVLGALKKGESLSSLASLDVMLGFIAAFAVGLFALKFLVEFVKKGRLHYFSYYCVGLSIVSVLGLTFII